MLSDSFQAHLKISHDILSAMYAIWCYCYR